MSAPPVKKACDACHRRKVRCSGGQPCKNCGQASLQCTYLAIPQKKGPKGSRAKVISEIRDTQQHSKQKSPTIRSITTSTSSSNTLEGEPNPFDFNSPPLSPTAHTRNPELLTNQTVDSCVNFFFSHLYPTLPIFSRQRLAELTADFRNNSAEVYCLVLSLCAFIMIQPGMTLDGLPLPASYEEDPTAARCRHANLLLTETNRVRKSIDYVESPTVYSVQISFFLFSSYFGLDRVNQSWYHLREATTLAHIMSMNDESTYRSGDRIDNMYKRRFYWLLLVTERAFAMERHKPLSMLATIELPTVDEEPSESALIAGFLYLVNVFRLIDDEFMALWNKAKSECSTSYLSQLQTQLADALPPSLECTVHQAADVRITQHWLRTMVWQLSITNGYLSSSSADQSMTFKYPIEITKELIKDIQSLSLESMEVHGVGLIEKLFDISCTLADVIACVPIDANVSTNGSTALDYLNQLLNLISQLRNGASRYVPLLMAKVAENLPNMNNSLSHMPLNLEAFTGGSSSGSSPLPTLNLAIQDQNQPTPLQTQTTPIVSPGSQYGANISHSPFGESHHSRGMMFDAYSPSGQSHSDVSMTPPISGYSPHQSNILNGQGMGMNMPRSVPLQTTPQGQMYEIFNG